MKGFHGWLLSKLNLMSIIPVKTLIDQDLMFFMN